VKRSRGQLPAWGVPLVLVLLIGLGLNAAVVPESLGRWQASSRRAVAIESAWILHYLVVSPRVGDRISTSLFVALAEGDNTWVATYLARQRAALDRAARRLRRTDVDTRRAALATDAMLDHDLAVRAAARDQPLDPFQIATTDHTATALRSRVERLLTKLDQTPSQ